MPTNKKTLFLAQFSMLLAIEAITCFTPLGSLPAVGPIVATLAHVPIVITGVLLGAGAGALMGFFAGAMSLIVWTFMPPAPSVLIAFVFTPFYSLGEYQGNFWSIVICIVPRILTGLVAGLVFRALEKSGRDRLGMILGGALGSLCNTFGVLGGVYVFFGHAYAAVFGKAYEAVLGMLGLTVLTSGVPEAIIGALAALLVGTAVRRFIKNRGNGG